MLREGNRLFGQEGNAAASVGLFRQALAEAQKVSSRRQRLLLESPVLLMLSQVHAALEQRTDAVACCQMAINVCRELGQGDREGMAMAILARVSIMPEERT